MKTLTTISALLLTFSLCSAQIDPTLDQQKEAISKLANLMAGTWQGPGWMKKGQAEPMTVNTTETVEIKNGGVTLLVQGLGVLPDNGQIVHDAMAIIHYDVPTQTYMFNTHLANGQHKTVEGKLTDNVFVWGFDLPNNAKIKYTITFENNTWKEIGEYSPSQNQWSKFFEMNLAKK